MYFSSTNLASIISSIDKMNISSRDVLLILLAEKNKPDVNQLISELNKRKLNFFGGIFPGIIYDDSKFEEGLLIKILPGLGKPLLIKGLDTKNIVIPNLNDKMMNQPDKHYTAIILVDGLAPHIALLLEEIFNRLGNSVHYLGGGAGSLSLQQKPCVFTPEGIFQNAAVITFVELGSHLGVRHGWKRIMGPVVATKTIGNIIVELNWRNAFEVYRKIIEEDSGSKLTPENFFDIAKGYPFGIYREGAEDIVRDPIAVNKRGELVCVGEIPENTVLYILKGKKTSLIQAADKAAIDCLKNDGKKVRHILIADCISRTLFLEDEFEKELVTIKKRFTSIKDIVAEGMLTLGEISSYGDEFLEFFNKTIVAGVLYAEK